MHSGLPFNAAVPAYCCEIALFKENFKIKLNIFFLVFIILMLTISVVGPQNRNTFVQFIWQLDWRYEKAETRQLMLQCYLADHRLNHIRAIKTVDTIDAEQRLLAMNESFVVNPFHVDTIFH